MVGHSPHPHFGTNRGCPRLQHRSGVVGRRSARTRHDLPRACTQHDFCYRTCNPIGGPYVGYGYKVGCDNNLAIGLSTACTTWSLILSFPNLEWVDQHAFLDECLTYASYGYGLVLSVGTAVFLQGQCYQYCNQWACGQLTAPLNPYPNYACVQNCHGGNVRGGLDDCDAYPWSGGCPDSPIGLDLQGNGFKLSGPIPQVFFDLDADGTPDHTAWTREQTKDGFLVLDRNQNGRIDNGTELFGTATPLLLSPSRAHHGYEALEEFDRASLGGNEDQVIDTGDAIFKHLQLWLDKNRDAVSQEDELLSLTAAGVDGISLAYYRSDDQDQWGNVFKWWSPIYLADGRISMSVDIFFERQGE